MAKTLKEYLGGNIELETPPEQISAGDIIKDYCNHKLIYEIKNNKLKTVGWLKDSSPSKIAEEVYEIFKTANGHTLIHRLKYIRLNPETEHYKKLIQKLEEAGVK